MNALESLKSAVTDLTALAQHVSAFLIQTIDSFFTSQPF